LLVVPSITIYEVFKLILRESTENEVLELVAFWPLLVFTAPRG